MRRQKKSLYEENYDAYDKMAFYDLVHLFFKHSSNHAAVESVMRKKAKQYEIYKSENRTLKRDAIGYVKLQENFVKTKNWLKKKCPKCEKPCAPKA